MRNAVIGIVAGLLLAATAVGLGYWLGRPGKIVETAAPAEVQADGSIIVERAPDAKAKPKQVLPKGAKASRIAQITAQGETPEANLRLPGAVPCPPVTIDTTLADMPDGSQRLLLSSPDGRITRSVDIPVKTAAPPPQPKRNAVGMSVDPFRRTFGVVATRDVFERVRIGVEINQSRPVIGGPVKGAEGRVFLMGTF